MTRSVSVVIPTYNRAHCVGEAIDSVLSQDPPADEIIVVDDGSTDDTVAILKAYGKRITLIRQENAGAAAARNTGLQHASCDWITFLDSDDLWYPGRLALLHHDLALEAARDIVMHMADVRFTGEGYDQRLFALRGWPEGPGDVARIDDCLPRAIASLHLNAFAARRESVARTAGFPADLKVSEDSYFMCAVGVQGPVMFSGTTVAEVRRVTGDDAGLVEMFRTDPVATRRMVQRKYDLLLDLPLSPAQQQLVRRHASGHLLKLAHAEALAGTGTARSTLLRMAREHPRPLIGWMKALPPLLLGVAGFNLLASRQKSFSRVTSKSD